MNKMNKISEANEISETSEVSETNENIVTPTLTHNERCKNLASAVENLSQTELEEMFKMIHEYNCDYSKNNNGIFVNLAWIPIKLLEQLEQYVLFCRRSGTELKKYESLCDVLNKKLQTDKIHFVSSSNKKTIGGNANASASGVQNANSNANAQKIEEGDEIDIDEKNTNKISSSMRFTLLKKKLAKVNVQNNIHENDLQPEEFLL